MVLKMKGILQCTSIMQIICTNENLNSICIKPSQYMLSYLHLQTGSSGLMITSIIHYIFYCATATEGEQWFDGHQVARGQSLGPPGPPTTYKPQPRKISYKLVIHTISSKNQIGSNTNAGVFVDILCKVCRFSFGNALLFQLQYLYLLLYFDLAPIISTKGALRKPLIYDNQSHSSHPIPSHPIQST